MSDHQPCFDSIKKVYANAKKISEMDWSKVPQEKLDDDDFRNGDPNYLTCPGAHCTYYGADIPNIKLMCKCLDAENKKVPGCTPAVYLAPYNTNICLNIKTNEYSGKSGRNCMRQGDNYYSLTCYCCCSCLAYGTKIGVPEGVKKIEDFVLGDDVYTTNVRIDQGELAFDWTVASVSFSNGTGPDGYQPVMMYVRFGDEKTIITTVDHLFLMPDGKLKSADKLVPGADRLVAESGEPVEILEVSLGEYHGGVHHIAIDKEFDGSMDGHLIISEGVVSGDFNLQIHSLDLEESGLLVNGHEELPRIGTEKYDKKYRGRVSCGRRKSYHRMKKRMTREANDGMNNGPGDGMEIKEDGNEPAEEHLGIGEKFYVFGGGTIAVPANCAGYLSPAQSKDVQMYGETCELADMSINSTTIQYVLRLYGGFYQDIVFYHDAGNLEPNAYAYEQYDKKIIVVTGGLSRIKGLSAEGLSVILSHMVMRLQKSVPLGAGGYTSVGMADYYSAVSLHNVFFGTAYNETYKKGSKQVESTIFSAITKENDNYAGDPYEPATELRLDALSEGFSMSYPPEGIGGPVYEGLQLLKATSRIPVCNEEFFVTPDIDREDAVRVFAALTEQGILNAGGQLVQAVDTDTDLSYLFTDKQDKVKAYLEQQVRYRLSHALWDIVLRFNLSMPEQTAFVPKSFTLSDGVSIESLSLDGGDDTCIILKAALLRGTVYTVRAARYVKSKNGSTLDPENALVTVGEQEPE